jgi:hypothetical protein
LPPTLHIISFDIPYPANYGGVIDVFYKIKALHAAGVRIRLHCFEYGRERAPELEELCEEVHYYPRKTGACVSLSWKPYIVLGRKSEPLLKNLLLDSHPILFEGLHSCYLLDHPRLRGRMKIYRESNIEHHYYMHLCRAERKPGRKLFYFTEGLKLKWFQPILKHADVMLTVSEADTQYLRKHFPGKKVVHLPSFHAGNRVDILPGKGNYALYHGKLSVPENYLAAEYLVREVFTGDLPGLVIAGQDPPDSLRRMIAGRGDITLVANPGDAEMFRLIREAQVNVMVTFQATGLKLKLLNALYCGRFCIVNKAMVAGTPLGALCVVAETPEAIRNAIRETFTREFTETAIRERATLLAESYDIEKNCKLLMETLHLL